MAQGIVNIGPVRCGPGEPLLLIAGPCVLETESLALQIAETLKKLCAELQIPLIFKASYDKANRTSGGAFRGLGLEKGLAMLAKIKAETGLALTTDIHESYQAPIAAKVIDLLQIPAFLARQTDLLVAAAQTGQAVNVKKAQFLGANDMQHVVNKLHQAGAQNVMLTERGTFFGYGRLVNDFGGLVRMRQFGVPVCFDATHSVQEPGGLGGATGGNRALVEPLARAAMAVGIDALFLETHPDPDKSPSDGPNMVPLAELPALLRRLLRLRETVRALDAD